jgi:PAS domain S-box-containing protein
MIPPHALPQSRPVRPPRANEVSAEWFGPLAHALPILIWTVDKDGQTDFLNTEAREYTGLDDASDFERAVHPDDLEGTRERAATSRTSGGRVEGRSRIRRARDGAWRWHSVRLVPLIDEDGLVIGAIGAAVDDHDRHTLVQANQELLASEQRARRAAEDAGRMKEEFLSALGHELRAPLNAIAGWASLLKRGLPGDEAARAIDIIERNSQAQRELIDGILDASRVLSGHARLELRTVYAEDALNHAVEVRKPEAEARGLTLDVALTSPRRPLTGDAARLHQVFALLLDNAVKFTPSGGRIDVRLWHDRHLVHVEVRDTGSGLSPAFLPFVFDRFRTADAAGSRPGGLGLGLALVRQLVQLHGGEVEARSDGPGRGSTFTLSLPTLELAADGGDEPVPDESRLTQDVTAPIRGLSILIIEDDADSREMLSVLLENVGAVPVAAATVGEGLRLLGDLEIDVVLSDIGMPGRDGFDLIRTLRSFPNPRVQHAPALAVTAFTRKEDRERILAAGFDAHVAKPVEPRELFAAIADTVRRRQSRTGATAGHPLP